MNKKYIPERGDIIRLDFEPTKGKEIGKIRPALVLSSCNYNKQKGFLICCPISTSIRGGKEEVPITGLDRKSVVVSSIVQTLAWEPRGVKHIAKVKDTVFKDVLLRLFVFMGAEEIKGLI